MSYPRHLIRSSDLSVEQIKKLFTLASDFQEQAVKSSKRLEGKTLVNLFYENSTRTRASFELAGKYLGAHILNFSVQGSSLAKGESLDDTVDTLISLGADAIVLRHGENGTLESLVKRFGDQVQFLNAGQGNQDHPSQGLLDVFTIHQLCPLEELQRKNLSIVGDIQHSRVARASLQLLPKLGIAIRLVGPEALVPDNLCHEFNCEIHRDLETGLKQADFVMSLRLQKERMTSGLLNESDYIRDYQINHERLKGCCKPSVKILHPGPVNRDIELSGKLMDDLRYSLIRQQVKNGLAIRMALLHTLLST